MTDAPLYRVGEHGPVVRKLGMVWRDTCVCVVVRAGNLQDGYGAVTRWGEGTVVHVKEGVMESEEAGDDNLL